MGELEVSTFLDSKRGVKDLVDQGVTEVPKFYRQELQQSCEATQEIPVVDFAGFRGSLHAQVIRDITDACEQWGFFQLVNHGVPEAVTSDMILAVEEFFNMPAEERMNYFSTDLWNNSRYGTSHNPRHESVLEWKDYLRHSCLPLEQAILTWPTKPSSYRKAASRYCRHMQLLADTLLEALSECLGLRPSYLDEAFGKEKLQEMFSNYYPPCPNPDVTVGIGEHSDAGGITILLHNGVSGLEVCKSGVWFPVKVLEGSLVVNLGDQIQILSNGRFKSVEHRARVNAEKTRISVPTFYQPSFDAQISPIAELLSDEQPAEYKEVKFRDYVSCFFRDKLSGKARIEAARI